MESKFVFPGDFVVAHGDIPRDMNIKKMITAAMDFIESKGKKFRPKWHMSKILVDVCKPENDAAELVNLVLMDSSSMPTDRHLVYVCVLNIREILRLGWRAYCLEMKKSQSDLPMLKSSRNSIAS